MIPDRSRQIADLYQAVRESPAGERAALLSRADPELRREVESLLAQTTEDECPERPPVHNAMAWLTDPTAPALAEGTLLGPYRIERKLGEGGMGEVYHATDTRLGRAVAVKLVHERFNARFRREAHAVSALNHPNICALYDIGSDDADYMVMELVEGDTLAARLENGALPIKTALVYASQMLSALVEAHAKGIVHRDLKPGNIMVAKSGIKILDFGLAKFVEDDTLTAVGEVMGTPAYMSPEQRQGQPAGPRSDIWSFGCVLHEMLTGTRAGLRRTRIPSRKLEAIVGRCLEEDPARRWQTAVELQRQLATVPAGHGWRGAFTPVLFRPVRMIAAACTLAAAMGAAGWFWFARPAHTLTDKDTIVLANFSNRTGDPVFDGTLQQGLSVQLEQSPFLGIVPESRIDQALTLMGRKPGTALTPDIATDLCQRVGSAAVIEGSIVQIGAPYQLTLKAVDCANGETLASTEAEAADKSHVLGALSNASSQIRTKLGESLSAVQKFNTPLEQATTSSLEALKAYSEGFWILRTGSDFPSAITQFKRAIELDPDFALAYGQLTLAYTSMGESRTAAEYARKGYALRDKVSEPEKYFLIARYGKSGNGDIDMAVQACLAWIQAYPRVAFPRVMLAGSIYPVIGEYDKAVSQATEGIRLLPTMSVAYPLLMDAYIALNRFDDAKAIYAQARKLNLRSRLSALDLYQIAFLENDAAGMASQVAALKGNDGFEDQMRAYEADTEAYYGHLDKARRFTEQAMDLALRAGGEESAANYLATSALREALFGNVKEAERRAKSALERASVRDVQFVAALTFGFSGNHAQVEALANDLARQYPEDTLVRFNYLPTLRAKLALDRGNTAEALETLKTATPYELGITRSSRLNCISLYPIYLRGEAYLAAHDGKESAAEYQRILDHPGIAVNCPIGPMARLRLAAALSNAGDRVGSATAYKALLDLWKGADPDLPVLKQARTEYARLN